MNEVPQFVDRLDRDADRRDGHCGGSRRKFAGDNWRDHEPRLQLCFGIIMESMDSRWSRRAIRGFVGGIGVTSAGESMAIDALPVEEMGTAFQREVWLCLREESLAAQRSLTPNWAEKIGRPKAVRAVGLANGANPVGVVVPCHRVIGADGSLTGMEEGSRGRAGCWNMRVCGLSLGLGSEQCFELWAGWSGVLRAMGLSCLSELRCPKENPGKPSADRRWKPKTPPHKTRMGTRRKCCTYGAGWRVVSGLIVRCKFARTPKGGELRACWVCGELFG